MTGHDGMCRLVGALDVGAFAVLFVD